MKKDPCVVVDLPPSSSSGDNSHKEKRSAGLLLHCVKDKKLLFLLQQPLLGRKAGFWMDLGGQCVEGETLEEGAVREFLEEGGMGCWSAEELRDAVEKTKLYMDRKTGTLYRCFLARVEWCDLVVMNERLKARVKQRRLQWMTEEELLGAWKRSKNRTDSDGPRLWKRMARMKLRKMLKKVRKNEIELFVLYFAPLSQMTCPLYQYIFTRCQGTAPPGLYAWTFLRTMPSKRSSQPISKSS
jgi:8-oxo-dGTP pyrophosphatase MutT (NUDIX family)